MGMMLPRINLNYHAYNALVYSISFHFSFHKPVVLQENNDQAFPVSR